jgi:Na+/H+ antiporter NhaA
MPENLDQGLERKYRSVLALEYMTVNLEGGLVPNISKHRTTSLPRTSSTAGSINCATIYHPLNPRHRKAKAGFNKQAAADRLAIPFQ